MCANSTYDLRLGRPISRFRFSRNTNHMDMKDAKAALDIIMRPTLHLWKLALGRSFFAPLKRSQKTVILCDANPSSSSISQKKRVRFDEQPVTISRRNLLGKFRRNSDFSPTSPVRPCLVVRSRDDVQHKPLELETDNCSVYEDCLSDHPDFLVDLHVLEGDERSHTQTFKYIRRSEFYETVAGIATFDRPGYADYCLSRWLNKQREGVRAPRKCVYQDRVLLPSKPPTLSPPLINGPDIVRPKPRLSIPIRRPPRSLPRRIWKYVEDELQNAVAVLIIGSFIHICLFLLLLYDVLARGLIPTDD